MTRHPENALFCGMRSYGDLAAHFGKEAVDEIVYDHTSPVDSAARERHAHADRLYEQFIDEKIAALGVDHL